MNAGDEQRPAIPPDHLEAAQPAGTADCAQVLADVFLYLDDEADEQVRDRIRAHLDACSPCLRKYGVEREVKALVARCCGNERAPESLRASIHMHLSRVTVGNTTIVQSTSEVRFRRSS